MTEEIKINEMFQKIRNLEIRNDRIGLYDDKTMVEKIYKYLFNEAKKELGMS